MKTNYHTHTLYCDGKGSVEENIIAARQKGFAALGFSSHAPIPLANKWTLTEENLPIYLKEVDRQKEKWADRIQVYKGLEIDYIPGTQAPSDSRWTTLGLDYIIGSVHSSTGLDRNPTYACVDGSREDFRKLLNEIHGGSMEELSEVYYQRIGELASMGGFDILGHFDLIKKHNKDAVFFSEEAPWYRRQVVGAIDALAAHNIIMEVNTGGIARGYVKQVYPSPWILAEAKQRKVRVTISADAHRPRDLDCYFDESRRLLKDSGYTETWALLEGNWTAVPL